MNLLPNLKFMTLDNCYATHLIALAALAEVCHEPHQATMFCTPLYSEKKGRVELNSRWKNKSSHKVYLVELKYVSIYNGFDLFYISSFCVCVCAFLQFLAHGS